MVDQNVNRRGFIKTAGVTAAAAATWGSGSALASSSATAIDKGSPPNEVADGVMGPYWNYADPALRTPADVYATVGSLLGIVTAATGFQDHLRHLDQVLLWDLRDPSCSITTDWRMKSDSMGVLAGSEGSVAPTGTVNCDAKTALDLLRGRIVPGRLQDSGGLRVTGLADRVIALYPLIQKVVAPLCEAHLRGDYGTEMLRHSDKYIGLCATHTDYPVATE